MTIRHLRIFAAVVDCGTMHAAAQKLYLSQPTITQAVKELEEHYGCLLFERYGRRLMITPAGQELLGHARELLGIYERMEQSMKQQAGQKLLRIGATVILAEQLLVPLIRAFEGQNPEVRVEVLVDNSSVLESRLLSGELDAALLAGSIMPLVQQVDLDWMEEPGATPYRMAVMLDSRTDFGLGRKQGSKTLHRQYDHWREEHPEYEIAAKQEKELSLGWTSGWATLFFYR